MKYLFLSAFIFSFTLCFSQSNKENIVNEMGQNPMFFLDSIRINKDEFRNINPQNISSLSTVTKKEATNLYGEEGKDGIIFVETKTFSKKRYERYFKSKSVHYKNLIESGIDDSKIQYILNDKILKEIDKGLLASIDDNVFKEIKIIRQQELEHRYQIIGKEFGVLITSEVPPNLYNGKEKFNK